MNPAEQKILVVDDYPSFRDLTRLMLVEAGYVQTRTAVDGVEALALLRAEEHHLVITDINMPRMNGFMLLRAIKEDPVLRPLPVFIMSTHAEQQYVEAALLRGAAGYLTKPFKPVELDQAIRQALAQSDTPTV